MRINLIQILISSLEALPGQLRTALQTPGQLSPNSRPWLLIIGLAFASVTLFLYAVPDVASDYWYMYAMPLTIATFAFGLRGALGGSIAATSGLIFLYYLSLSVHTEVAAALEILQGMSREVVAGSGMQVLVDQALAISRNDARSATTRGIWGLLIIIFINIWLGLLVDRGRLLERQAMERATDQLKRYFSPQLIRTIVTGEQWVGLSTVRKEVTMLFTDLRGFTALAEQVEPEELGEMLNRYLGEMTEVIFKYDGTLDKYIGDAVMAFFGDPISHGDDAERAIRAAVEMRERFQAVRTHWAGQGLEKLDIGIGINTGFVTVGNVGSDVRMEYTVIGSAVNVAARLADLAAPGQILTSSRTLAQVGHLVEWRGIGPTPLDGMAHPIEVAEVAGLRLIPERADPAQALGPLDLVLGHAADDQIFRSLVLTRTDVALKPFRLTPSEQEFVIGLATLLGYSIFQGLDGMAVIQLVHRAKVERFLEGTVILKHDDPEPRFCLVSRGEVALLRTDAQGIEHHALTLGRGGHFGEPDWLLQSHRKYTVRAMSQVELLVLQEHDLRYLEELAPAFVNNIRRETRQREREVAPTQVSLPALSTF